MQHILGTKIDASMYTRSPAIVEAAKDWRYYESTIIRNNEMNAAMLKEYKEGGAWKAHYKTWRDACEPLGKSRSQIDRLIQSESESSASCATFTKANTLEKVNSLANPISDEELLGLLPKVHTKASPQAKPEPEPEPEKATEPPKDCMGYPIPQRCLTLWNQRDDVQGYLTAASRLKCLMDELQEGCKGVYVPMQGNVQTHMVSLKTIHYHLSMCKPWAVCPVCDGSGKASGLMNGKKQPCRVCYQVGLVSERVYNGPDHWGTGHTEKELKAIYDGRKAKCTS
jgi:hypothetical protein